MRNRILPLPYWDIYVHRAYSLNNGVYFIQLYFLVLLASNVSFWVDQHLHLVLWRKGSWFVGYVCVCEVKVVVETWKWECWFWFQVTQNKHITHLCNWIQIQLEQNVWRSYMGLWNVNSSRQIGKGQPNSKYHGTDSGFNIFFSFWTPCLECNTLWNPEVSTVV